MTEERRGTVRWPRLLAEGTVIVTSILLAFAIDAWWDGRTEDRLIAEQRAQLRAQMQANSGALATGADRARAATEALTRLTRLIRPEPELMSADTLAELIYQGFRIGPTPLQMNAMRVLLSSGQFALSESQDLHGQLIGFESRAEYLRASEELYWEIRLLVSDYLSQVAPLAMVTGRVTGAPTDFEVPVRRVLTDMRLEGLLGELAVRSLNIAGRISELRVAADSIVALTR